MKSREALLSDPQVTVGGTGLLRCSVARSSHSPAPRSVAAAPVSEHDLGPPSRPAGRHRRRSNP